jgi:hypothetical protein
MRIKEIIIGTLKLFKELELECNENSNFIVGKQHWKNDSYPAFGKASFDTLIQKKVGQR